MKENESFIKEEQWLIKELRRKNISRHVSQRVFVFSADRKNYYKIYAPNEHSALQAAMSIGENPAPNTDPPPSPGKPKPVPPRQFSKRVVPISKGQAELLIRQESLLYGRNKAKNALQKKVSKRGRLARKNK